MPTAIDSIHPTHVFSELQRMRNAIATAVEAEAELEKTRKVRNLKLSQEITRREEADAETFTARLAELAVNHQALTARKEWEFLRRTERLPHAYHSSRATLARRLQEKKDQAVAKAHGVVLSERKKYQGTLSEATEEHRLVMEGLHSQREELRKLRDSGLTAFRSYRPLIVPLFKKKVSSATTEDPGSQADALRKAVADAQRQPLAKLFRYAPLWLLALVAVGIHFAITRTISPTLLIAPGAVLLLWLLGYVLALPVARRIASAYLSARALSFSEEKASAAKLATVEAEIEERDKNQNVGLTQSFEEAGNHSKALLVKGQEDLQRQLATLPDRILDLHRKRLARIDREYQEAVGRIHKEIEETAHRRKLARSSALTATDTIIESSLSKLAEDWNKDVTDNREKLTRMEAGSQEEFPAWSHESVAAWEPKSSAPQAIRIGRIEIDATKLPGGIPQSSQLSLKNSATSSAPLALGFPERGSLLIESNGTAENANAALNAASLRILSSMPPGRASFLFIDPVGLGRDFAGLMHLADYEETLINHRIWTQTTQIEERLAEVNEHIEKVIQMYLRNEFATIAEYNQQAGAIAEKYHFVVIAGFPSGFSETAAKRLLSIAASGPRCGVHLLIQRDLRLPSVDRALDEELRRSCLHVTLENGVFRLGNDKVIFDTAPSDEDANTLIHKIGQASVDSNRVEVPFSQIAPSEDAYWKLDTSEELRVPVGRTGAKKLQMLAIGKGTRQHALIAGKTGSGKSTLFHVIITNLALWCSPDQVEFYLVDFKKGVEFKCYADKRLPHAKVVAIESDRGFALSVLQRVDAELKRRGELFRKASSQDLAAFNRSGEKPLPRTLLLIDEFQEFFTEDDTIAQQASLLLDRIVRQGRAFGIHVILGSQTLGGAYTLARATLGQMAVRIALQCNETDAHLIMDEDNPAPRLLTRPGEGIYNDQSGMMAANSPFQIVWLPERERDALLDRVNTLARQSDKAPAQPIVFEGNAPAEIRDNPELEKALRVPASARPATASAWLGAPNSIKGPTAAVFKRHSGSNLLAVSQSPEQSVSLLASSIISLAAQYPPDQVEFIILDPQAADEASDSPLKTLASRIPHTRIGGPTEVSGWLSSLSETLENRAPTSGKNAPEIYLIIHDLQRFKALRPDDEFRFSYDDTPTGPSPSQIFANLLGDGGPNGIHVIATIDTWNNVSRWIPRKLLAEFEMRVLFQMSANDSSNLIDSPAASTLGLHRALLHNEHLGTLEIFRPYSQLEESWLEEAATALASPVT